MSTLKMANCKNKSLKCTNNAFMKAHPYWMCFFRSRYNGHTVKNTFDDTEYLLTELYNTLS
jgi:hypothetical protein